LAIEQLAPKIKTQEKALAKMNNIPEDIKKKALGSYLDNQMKQFTSDHHLELKTYEEKISIIKKQNPLVNYYKLVEMGYISDEAKIAIQASGYLEYAEFLDTYRYLENSERDIKDIIREKIDSIQGSLVPPDDDFDLI
jgi:hypothetical protein